MPIRALILCLLSIAVLGCSSDEADKPLLIGHLAPFQGPHRQIGEDQRRALQLIAEEVNQPDQRISGRKIAFVHVDSGADPVRARGQVVRLFKVNRALCILSGDSALVADRVAPTLQQYKVAGLTAAPLYANRDGAFFSVTAPPKFHGQVLARFAQKKLKCASALVVFPSKGFFGTTVRAAFEEEWNQASAGPLRSVSYGDKVDVAQIAEQARAREKTVVVFSGGASDFRKLHQLLNEGQTRVPILCFGDAFELDELLIDPPAEEGAYCARIYVDAALSPAGRAFVSELEKRNKREPTLAALHAAEMAQIAIQSLRDAEKKQAADLQIELSKDRTFEVLTGQVRFEDGYVKRSLHVVSLKKGVLSKAIQSYAP